jgi:hypothetical protein
MAKSINAVINTILNALDKGIPQSMFLPPGMVAFGSFSRSGLVSRAPDIISDILSREAEAGRYFGPLLDGSQNPEERMIVVIVESILKSILNDAKVVVEIPPGGLTLPSAAGPVTNALPVQVSGIIV